MEIITLFCCKCRKSTRVDYIVEGNNMNRVLPTLQIRCRYCKRVIRPRNYTEGMLLACAKNGKCEI